MFSLNPGIGNSMSAVGGLLTLDKYFCKKKSMATGISHAGVGAAMLILPPLLNLLMEHYGYQVREYVTFKKSLLLFG